jgi:outer membrane lipoprotein-sorting protein
LFAAAAWGADPRSILEEVQKRAKSQSQRYEGTLQVIGAENRVTTKRWVYERLNSLTGVRAMLRFTAPEDVKGVALLIVSHPLRASDQWMWRPEIGREQRISFQDRSTRFFGTDFSFEDLEERDPKHFELKLLSEDGGVWKLDAKPKRQSQYTRSTITVRKENYTIAQVESFDRNGLVRDIRYRDFAQVKGIWTAMTTEVLDAVRKGRTVLKLEKVEYNVPLDKDKFTLDFLRKQ